MVELLDLESNIRRKYRYSTRGQVEYWATIRPTIRPRKMAEYRTFFEWQVGVELLAEVCNGLNCPLFFDLPKHTTLTI